MQIKNLSAWEILDSRGRPTIKARCDLASGRCGVASIPAGASTGKGEAVELRDGDSKRYRGLGCQRAVAHINGEMNLVLSNRSFGSQCELDQTLIELDGTPNKSRLGANAILAVSLSFARASADELGVPLHQHFASMLPQMTLRSPQPTINLFSGGKHAGGQVPIQDVLIVPTSSKSVSDALAMSYEVYQCAAEVVLEKYGMRPLTADEGGFAPAFENVETMLDRAIQAIKRAGFRAGKDFVLALDVAASHFCRSKLYYLSEPPLRSQEMVDRIVSWVNGWPIVSVEDGLGEDDWEFWPVLCEALSGKAWTMGDDFLCTNASRIQKAITNKAANSLLLKVNQVGTLTEAAEAYRLSRSAGWNITISARSGETEDNWLADLAVGWGADQIKIGSLTRSERLAKYNRLLEIEYETNLPMASSLRIVQTPN